jgi:RNA polymerase nonessential primary-like sigma factor
MPPYITGILNKVKKTNRQLSQSLMRTPTLSELAEAMDMPLEKLEVYLQANKSTKSIDNFNLSENIGDSSAPDLSKSSCLDIIADPSNVDRLDLISDKDEVIYYLSCLTPIQRTVVTNYYGLTEDNTQYRFSEIAKMINLTPQRTRHIYKEAMGRMTRLMEAKAKINNQRNNRYLMRIKNKTVKEG